MDSHPSARTAGDTRSTRRSALAGGVGAGALAAGLMSASRAEAQTPPPPDDRYVWRDRMPVNVKDHGATGDGTTNDTAAIRAAIKAVTDAGGGTVFFPPGDYVVNPITDENGNTVCLTIPPLKPVRLLGSGMALSAGQNLALPTRLIRKVAGAPLLKAVGSSFTNRVCFAVSDLEFRGNATTGTLVHAERGNGVEFNRVSFVGATGTGLLMRNVFNSSGSDLRWSAAGNLAADPACLFDGVTSAQGGSDTVQWTNLQFEGNGGTDLKMTGDTTNTDGTVTTTVQMSQIKMEGGTANAVNCPYLDLDYTQGCKFSNVSIGMHGGRTVPPLRKSHPFGGTRADQFVNLSIDKVGAGTFACGIDHIRAALLLDNVTILGVPIAIRVNSTVAPGDFQLGTMNTNTPRAVQDLRTARPTVASAASIGPPREGLVEVTGTTNITSITTHEQGYTMTLLFSGTLTVVDGGNLRLAGNFTTTSGDTLTLVSDGANWYEVARSVN